jgi:hypothetical protein
MLGYSKAKVGNITVTNCKFCPVVAKAQNLFATFPVIGKYFGAFPVYFCGDSEDRLIPSAANFDGVPSWCPHAVTD